MNWDARKHFDKEAREKLRASIPDESLLKQVERAYDGSIAAVERKEIEIQDAYATVAKLLEQTSEVSGVSPAQLMVISYRMASSLAGLEWYQVLGLIRQFHVIKASLAAEDRA